MKPASSDGYPTENGEEEEEEEEEVKQKEETVKQKEETVKQKEEAEEQTCEEQKHVFKPLSVGSQRVKCEQLGFQFQKKSGPMGQVLNKPFGPSSPPTRIKAVRGDGNCFFRAISYVLTGEEDQHEKVWQLICEYIEKSKESVWGAKGKAMKGKEYLNESGMRQLKKWGTTDEIFAASNLLQVPIFTYSPYANRLQWMKHIPSKDNRSSLDNEAIYIDNQSGDHYNIVMSVKSVF